MSLWLSSYNKFINQYGSYSTFKNLIMKNLNNILAEFLDHKTRIECMKILYGKKYKWINYKNI